MNQFKSFRKTVETQVFRLPHNLNFKAQKRPLGFLNSNCHLLASYSNPNLNRLVDFNLFLENLSGDAYRRVILMTTIFVDYLNVQSFSGFLRRFEDFFSFERLVLLNL